MSLALLIAIGGLITVGVYLVTARSLSRIILGFSLLGHATVLSLLVAGGPPGQPPLGPGTEVSNPLPQALGLTAIVISFGLTLFLLALAVRQQTLTGDDQVEDDIEDRRIAIADGGDDDGRNDVVGEVGDRDCDCEGDFVIDPTDDHDVDGDGEPEGNGHASASADSGEERSAV